MSPGAESDMGGDVGERICGTCGDRYAERHVCDGPVEAAERRRAALEQVRAEKLAAEGERDKALAGGRILVAAGTRRFNAMLRLRRELAAARAEVERLSESAPVGSANGETFRHTCVCGVVSYVRAPAAGAVVVREGPSCARCGDEKVLVVPRTGERVRCSCQARELAALTKDCGCGAGTGCLKPTPVEEPRS